MHYINLLLLTIVMVYIIDLSGFTETWKAWLWRRYRISQQQSIKPFDCSTCMTWWAGIIYMIIARRMTLTLLAYIAVLSLLALPIGQLLLLIREALNRVINRLIDRL